MDYKKDSKELAELKKLWEKKLAQSGFNDIERPDGNLKVWDCVHFSSNFEVPTFQATERYYQLAGQLLHDYPFINLKERRIWQLHASGKTLREISKELKANRRYITSVIERVSRWVRV